MDHSPLLLLGIAAVGVWAGIQNALAGGGSFITFPTLLLAGLNPLAANMTSTIALFPSQLTASLGTRKGLSYLKKSALYALIGISFLGGILGGLFLLLTPVHIFAHLVPWLILMATSIFAWGSFIYRPLKQTQVSHHLTPLTFIIQGIIAIYGGYFGGGIGFLMLALLTISGQTVREANALKNILATVMNGAAVLLFAFSPMVDWLLAATLAAGGILGGLFGAWLHHYLPEKWLRVGVVIIGLVLTTWLFVRMLQ